MADSRPVAQQCASHGTDAALFDLEALRTLKARYFRLLDTKDWVGFAQLFTPDVRVDVSADGAGILEGLDAVMADA